MAKVLNMPAYEKQHQPPTIHSKARKVHKNKNNQEPSLFPDEGRSVVNTEKFGNERLQKLKATEADYENIQSNQQHHHHPHHQHHQQQQHQQQHQQNHHHQHHTTTTTTQSPVDSYAYDDDSIGMVDSQYPSSEVLDYDARLEMYQDDDISQDYTDNSPSERPATTSSLSDYAGLQR